MKSQAERLHELIEGCVTPPTSFTPTIKECQDILDELDKPELDPDHEGILTSLVSGVGCVFKVESAWRWFHKGITLQYDHTILTMIDLGLLDTITVEYLEIPRPGAQCGMTAFTRVTDAGIEALKR